MVTLSSLIFLTRVIWTILHHLLPKIFPKEMLREEMNKDKYVPIPEEVRKEMMQYSPNNSGQKYKARKVPTADKECQNIVQTRECVTKKLQTKNHINANVHKR